MIRMVVHRIRAALICRWLHARDPKIEMSIANVSHRLIAVVVRQERRRPHQRPRRKVIRHIPLPGTIIP